MDLAEFSQYFSLDAATQDFIVKYGFNEIADRLEDIPESLSDEYILAALSKLRKKPEADQILAAAAELREICYGVNVLDVVCCKKSCCKRDNNVVSCSLLVILTVEIECCVGKKTC